MFGRLVGADEFVNEILTDYKNQFSDFDGRIYLYGHSAGGQFVSRYIVRHPAKVIAAVISAAGTYAFPDPKMMRKIIDVHFPEIDNQLAETAISTFYKLRELDGIEKRPATRELINWIRALNADPDFKSGDVIENEVPFLGVLFKKSGDFARAANYSKRRTRF